uniref:Disease resistance protein RPS4B/Roq1-like leucine-rich repeats domain-containing protein n=1 Tax=Fagus sylvatica TaxID=28930 RepID=A0A2N9FDH6_FAGSY
MNFRSCQYIRKLPDLSIATPNIKELDLCQCGNLIEVHDFVGRLDKLEKWELNDCIELQVLPNCLLMKSLKHLSLYGCSRLEKFPNILQEMEGLKFLSMVRTAITELPPSFGNLTGLHQLYIVPGNEIPKWVNHQSFGSTISFWVGSKFPTFVLCLALCLDRLAYEDTYSYVCVVDIFTNGHKRRPIMEKLFDGLQYDHLWFYGAHHSLLQQVFGDLIEGDRNHVEIAPFNIASLGVHVECICGPQNSLIIHDNCENVDDGYNDTELPPLLSSMGFSTA